jgi:hypothetical protein
VSDVDPNLLAEFNALTEQAEDYRRHSFGARSRQKQLDEQGRSYFYLLSQALLRIHHMVRLHPELKDEYLEWRRLYPSFTCDETNGPRPIVAPTRRS